MNLLSKKSLPKVEPPITIETLIESSRTHSPDIRSGGSLNQGQITTRNSLGYILQNVRAQGALTPEEWQYLINHMDEIRSNAEIQAYIDRLNPWDGYTWQKLWFLVERVKG